MPKELLGRQFVDHSQESKIQILHSLPEFTVCLSILTAGSCERLLIPNIWFAPQKWSARPFQRKMFDIINML